VPDGWNSWLTFVDFAARAAGGNPDPTRYTNPMI
jgi:hypothetical protein